MCDEFNSLFKKSEKQYMILRHPEYYKDERSWLLNSIHETINCVLIEDGVDRQHFLYTRKGHKAIQLKAQKKMK